MSVRQETEIEALRRALLDAERECTELGVRVTRLEAALRQIGTPKSVPRHFDPLDWWRHTASKNGEIARDALGLSAEELILSATFEYGDTQPVPKDGEPPEQWHA